MYACIMYACMQSCMHIMYAGMYHTCIHATNVPICVQRYVCMCTYVYVCVRMCIFPWSYNNHAHTHTCTHTHTCMQPGFFRAVRAIFPWLYNTHTHTHTHVHTHIHVCRVAFFRAVRAMFPWLRAQRKDIDGTLKHVNVPVFVMYGSSENKHEHAQRLARCLGVEAIIVPEVCMCVCMRVCL